MKIRKPGEKSTKSCHRKGSVMVEAALILPLIMLLSVTIINTTIGYYKGVCWQAESHRVERDQGLDNGAVNNDECEFARRADLFID